MIGPIDRQPIRLERTESVQKPATEQPTEPQAARRGDRVEISAEARQRAAAGVEGLSPERVAEIRQRIADGTYSKPEVIEQVARAIIEQSDV